MKLRIGLLVVAVVLGVSLSAVPALAVNEFCDTVTATECQVTTLHNLGAGGTFTVDRVLHIIGPLGELRTNPNSTLTLNIAGGSPNGLIIDSGGKITGNAATAAQIGATININVATGNILLAASGATISAANTAPGGCGPPLLGKGGVINITANGTNAKIITEVGTTISVNGGALPSLGGCPAGAINISAPNQGEIDIDGNVLAESTQTGTGNNQRPGGGPINIIAGCGLTISDTGVVSSKGKDPGADRVHLEGCFVTINGLVQSTGDGHTIPNNPPNHCNNNAGAGGGDRPDKPSNSTACVEIWSGTTVTINSIAPHNGQVNADVGLTGGGTGRSWIDIYANGAINIVGDNTGPFSVHANMSVAGIAGIITIKSLNGDVVASGLAIQADNIAAGGDGGVVKVQAKNNVSFAGASIFARGDFDSTGGFGVGGVLGPLAPVSEPIRAFTGSLSWTTGEGNVRPTGSAVPVAQRGQINLQACGPVTLGASFPVDGAVVPPFPNILASSCVGDPTKPAYVVLPLATCINQCGLPSKKKGTKFNDLDDSKTKGAGEPGLPNWEIRVFDAANMLVASALTNASGNYEINLAPGSYKVCEVLKPGWTQTCPTAGGLDCNGVATTIANCAALGADLGAVGYAINLASGQTDEGNDFGNNQTAKKKGMKFDDLDGNGLKNAGELGLPNWEIRVFDAANALVASAFTNASGNYEFNLAPGSYKVCEVLQVGSTQTCPTGVPPNGTDCSGNPTTIASCAGLGAGLGPVGYAITLTSGQTDEGNDFGNRLAPCVGQACPGFCELVSVQVALNPATGPFPGNLGPDVIVDARVSSIQAAINSASDVNGDGYIIIGVIAMDNKQPGGTVTQSINISQFYPAPFALIACGVTLRDSDTCDTVGPIVITASGGGTGFPPPLGPNFNVYVQDFTAINTFSAPGWLVLGTGRYLENPGATGDSIGIKVVGNGNVIHLGFANQNFQQGVLVQGNGNTIDGVVANKNGLEGIQVIGDNNDVLNSLAGDAGAGNNREGIKVSGRGNLVSGNSAFANRLDGIAVSGGVAGNPNVVVGNQAGAVGKGNQRNGILINGTGNGAALPIEIEANTTKSNRRAGIRVTSGTGNQLKDNVSGGVTAAENNGECEYLTVGGNSDAGGNVTNGVPGPVLIPGCTGTP